jgi:hypothetical protein
VWGVGVQNQKHTENVQEKKHLTGILSKELAVTKENIHSSITVENHFILLINITNPDC